VRAWRPGFLSGLALLLTLLGLGACGPQLQPSGPLAHSSHPQPGFRGETTFVAADGVELAIRRWPPVDAPAPANPKVVVLALHGFNDYSNAFAMFGRWAAERDILVYAYDQRGFGATAWRGLWPGGGRLIGDLRAVVRAVRRRHRDSALFVLGESMGGAVVMAAWAEAPLAVDGIVLAGPAVWGREVMPFYQSAALWLGARLLPWKTLTGRRLDIAPSNNKDVLIALARDPLVIKATRIDAIWGLVDLMDRALAGAARFDAPALVMYGLRDEIIPRDAVAAMLERLPPSPARTLAIYEDHFHMLLRDLEAEAVWQDIAAWMAQPGLERLPSGAAQDREALRAGTR